MNPSGRTMALGSTQPLTEMSTRNISWRVNAAGAYDGQPYHLHVPIVLKSGSLNLLEPSGPVMRFALPFLPLASRPGRFSLEERPQSPCAAGNGSDLRTGPDAVKGSSLPFRKSTRFLPIFRHVA